LFYSIMDLRGLMVVGRSMTRRLVVAVAGAPGFFNPGTGLSGKVVVDGAGER
jgi:hypothetical protein